MFGRSFHGLTIALVAVFCQGEIRYEAIGVYPATTFFAVNSVSGAVTITTDLRNDALLITSYTVSQCVCVCVCV